MRTLPCKECNMLYTDNIDEKVDESKGGYIICAYCSMKNPASLDSEPKQEEVSIPWKKKGV